MASQDYSTRARRQSVSFRRHLPAKRNTLVLLILAVVYATYTGFWTADSRDVQVLDFFNRALHIDHPQPVIEPLVAASPAWRGLKAALQRHTPGVRKLTLNSRVDPEAPFPTDPKDVEDLITITHNQIWHMKTAHAAYVDEARSGTIHLDYEVDTAGIVTTVSDDDLGLVVLQVLMLRRTECQLPVEVFVSSDAVAQSPVCTDMLAGLNTKCISMAAIVGSREVALTRNGYLNKMVALLFSSFDDTLFLDADNMPLVDIGEIFQSKAFTSTGLVLWPDFWPSTMCPTHNVITDVPDPIVNGTFETGQIVVSKQQHEYTLLLALYYNFYGPEHYYVLESQNGMGAGDKGKPGGGWKASE